MTWARLDDGFWQHPKVLGLTAGAYRLYVNSICWSSRNLTDGFIQTNSLPLLMGTPKNAAELVEARLWDVVENGWAIHDFLDYNPTRDSVLAKREKAKESGRQGGLAKGNRNASESLSGMLSTSPVPLRSPVPQPVPIPLDEDSLRSSSSSPQVVPRGRDNDPEFATAIGALENMGVTLTATLGEMLSSRLESGCKAAWVQQACGIAASNGARSANYVWRILDGWGAGGPPEVRNGVSTRTSSRTDNPPGGSAIQRDLEAQLRAAGKL